MLKLGEHQNILHHGEKKVVSGIDEPIFLPGEINIGFLKKWQGAYICGGGKNECLKEVLILFSTFNITVHQVGEFIY